MKSFFREPLLHFLLMGAALFGLYTWRNRGADADTKPRQVHISADDVQWLKETWSRQWRREPDEAELRGLVTDYLKESLLAREAAEIGLEENDTVIRRRLAQKMDFLIKDTAELSEPDENQLLAYYEAHQSDYTAPTLLSFTQRFFQEEAGARESLASIAAGGSDDVGDRSLLEPDHAHADLQAIAGQFGTEFATALAGMPAGSWRGPVKSAYGFHLVLVREREEGGARPLAEVRTRVLEDWQREQQVRAREQFFATLLKKYDVVVDESIKPLVSPILN